jgi:hypothetical protein
MTEMKESKIAQLEAPLWVLVFWMTKQLKGLTLVLSVEQVPSAKLIAFNI